MVRPIASTCRRPVVALPAGLLMATVTVGCARVSPDAALAVADRYYAALARSDTAAACGLMTESQRKGFEGGACEDVMRFLLDTDGPPGRYALQPRGVRVVGTGDRQSIELRYQVAYGKGPRVDILTIVGTAGQPDSFRIDGIARQEALVAD
jgi:hypothetical protein